MRVGDGVNVAVDVRVRVLLCVGVVVRVFVLVAVALGVCVGSSVRVFIGTGDESMETRVGIDCAVGVLQLARISALNSANRKMTRRIHFLS